MSPAEIQAWGRKTALPRVSSTARVVLNPDGLAVRAFITGNTEPVIPGGLPRPGGRYPLMSWRAP